MDGKVEKAGGMSVFIRITNTVTLIIVMRNIPEHFRGEFYN